MMSSFNAKIEFDAKEKTKAIFDSINTDNKFYPENPTETIISFKEQLIITIKSNQIPQLRANLNSTLRLLQTSYDSIESVRL
jgi:KEOPS complex subunit Pcc1